MSGPPGWQLALPPAPGEVVIRKREDDGFAGTGLDALLRAARAAEWSPGDEIVIAPSAADVVFRPPGAPC
ncbi:hypothetical protein HJ588_18770 [Flexivirga sp. ID2601S]|uniref:Uncharacterized protein n=1 Tax=Flexivirga aerilata TaxID=1656889 RepID=A0A849ANE8_9MICO|nr:hypothetical protein [Flexivirga aerilata]NNG41307.1 hypothetical protein [Flexivirga aerilata]